ncbi:hypothetical protein AGMMS50268_17160 [Spirochaetia bacterium]|nr:hypothetical protein AGMMS50268_17160 [Spirochaetia bacterium]
MGKREEKASVKAKAKQLGISAFHAGKKCIPALDKAMMDLLESPEMDAFGPPEKMGRSIPVLKAWIERFTEAKLDAPIQGWTDEENRKYQEWRKDYKAGKTA